MMHEGTLFLAELWIGKLQIAQNSLKNFTLAFRIGKTQAQSNVSRQMNEGTFTFNLTMQLNTDRTALQTKRCSLTLTSKNEEGQPTTVGMALFSIPKQYSLPPKKFRLTQSRDKTAQIELALRIIPLDEASSDGRGSSKGNTMSQSSFRSIMQMQDFDRHIVSPPHLFEIQSQITQKSNQLLLPPKPRSSRQRKNPLTASINSQAIVEDRIDVLENECLCLKKLLRIQMDKNQESTKMIEKLVQALECSTDNTSVHRIDWEQPCLLNDKEEEYQPSLPRKVKKQQKKDCLLNELQQEKQRIKALSIQNELLIRQNRELTDLILKLADYTEEQESKIVQKQNPKDKDKDKELIIKLKNAEKSINEATMKFEKLKNQLMALHKELQSKQQEIEQFKKKTKIQSKNNLKHVLSEKNLCSPTAAIKSIMERATNDRKQLVKQLLKCSRRDETTNQGLFGKLKAKIDRSFSVLVGKRLNKDILMAQKIELIRVVEECIRQFSSKMIQY